jgi:hypothetical protein
MACLRCGDCDAKVLFEIRAESPYMLCSACFFESGVPTPQTRPAARPEPERPARVPQAFLASLAGKGAT